MSKNVESQYERRAGAANMSGVHFETKMATLLFLRGVNSNQEFRIASNMAAAGKFDDFVFTMGQKTAFLQLKHKMKKDAKIYMSQLLTVKGDFSLLQYCKSYVDIKRQWTNNPDLQYCGRFKDSLFIVFTNASLAGNDSSNVGCSGMLNILNTQGKLIRFTKQQHGELYDTLENLPRYKQLLFEAVNSEQVPDTPELLEVVKILLNNHARCVPGKKDLAKLFFELQAIGDLSEYREFLSKFLFYTEQTRESGLDSLIIPELKTLFGNDIHFLELKEGIEIWWKKSKKFLMYKAKFFQDIIKKIAANIAKKIPDLRINFTENEREIFREKVKSGGALLYIHTDCTSVSSVKVLQSLLTNLLIDVSALQTHFNEVLAVWRLGTSDVLVVEGDITDTNILHQLVSMLDSKSVVVISSTKPTQLHEQFKFISFTDTFSLSQLDSDSQQEILEKEIIFQGFPLKLNSLADVNSLNNVVTGDVVLELHKSLEVGHKLEDLDPCYIPRTFLRKEYVSEEIFSEENITLAVTRVPDSRLKQLVPRGETFEIINLNNITRNGACRYFLIEREDEFTALCRVKDNIHWIEACERDFLWKSSKGDMYLIKKHLVHKYVSYANVEEVVAFPHQVVVVVAEPGMGKSTEMCNIAHTMKQIDHSTWVLRIDLNQHTNLLSQKEINAVEFLEKAGSLNTLFQKHLFEHEMQFNRNIVIILDGFDEIAPRYSEKVLCLLTELSLTGIEKIFITSRSVMLEQLQQKLSTLAFSFKAFTSEDQKKFLTKYWNHLYNNSYDLKEFISSMLQLVGNSLNDTLREIAGIPLQCRMLAEIFQDDALHYCHTGEIRLPQCLDVLELYEKLFDKKWDVHCKKLYEDTNTAMLLLQMEELKEQLRESIMNCAVFSYFDDNFKRCLKSRDNIMRQNEVFVKKFSSGREKNEIIINFVDDKAVFVHHTFTEYFVAKWFSQHFHLELDCVKIIYFCKNFEVVQKFLDRILARKFKLHTAVLNEDLDKVKHLLLTQNSDVNEKDEGYRSTLHLAVMNYYYNKDKANDCIIETLLEHGVDVNSKDKVLHWSPLRLGEKIRAWSVVDKLLENQADSRDLVWISRNVKKHNLMPKKKRSGCLFLSRTSASKSVKYDISEELQQEMYSIVSKGLVNVVEFILNCGLSLEHYIYRKSIWKEIKTSMLHIAAKNGQLKLVQFLIDKGISIDIFSIPNKRTALMDAVEFSHVQVVELLIIHGASLNARDKFGDTALSIAVLKGKHEVVELLLHKEADVNLSDYNNRTPLMVAAEFGHVQVVDLLVKHGAYVNARDSVGDTALSILARKGKYEVVELLLHESPDINLSNNYNITPLIGAAQFGHVHVVELLIKHGASVNARDKGGDTALSRAAWGGKYELVELLLQKGADVDLSNNYNITPLIGAAQFGHVQVVDLLIKHGASVNARDSVGDTALSRAAWGGKYEPVALLLQKGADVDLSNNYNITPLIGAAQFGHMQVVELLIKHGASVNARDDDRYTALLRAAWGGKYELVELLLQKGADVDLSNNHNITPLIGAAQFGHVQIVELLIKHGASVNARDDDGYTALLRAAWGGKYDLVELLLQKGADVDLSNNHNITPLIGAAQFGHVQVVELFIKHGASVNARDKHGYTAVSRASWGGKYESVELLLQKRADVDLSNNHNITPLIGAAQFGHVQVVELLIKHGASVNARDKDGYTALSRAAWEGKYEPVELLLQKGADVDLSNNHNITPLIGAAQFGHAEVVELLIKHGASVNARDIDGYTALSKAAWGGKYEPVELLLEKGADVDLSNNHNITPLIGAAQFGHVQVVELLIKHGASVNATDKDGYTALLRAAWGGKYELVELLLQKGADVDLSNNHNITPLIGAAQFGHVQVVELLIKHGASVNARDKDGYTALSRAAWGGKYEPVELLLQKGADVDLSNNHNITPLIGAAQFGHVQVVEILIKHGASVNARDKDGYTAVSRASWGGKYESVELLLQKRADVDLSNNHNITPLIGAAQFGHVQVVELLIKHGASVNARDKDGYTALSRAAWGGKYELVELLLQKGADVDLSNNHNITPLIGAAQFGHVQVVELLIKYGAYVNARDKDGYTALLRAAWGGKYELVELLLQKGADVDLCNNYNITPLIVAAQFGHVQVVDLLIKHGASVNARGKDGYTALSRASWGGKYELVELLLQKGADDDLSNNYNNTTPLKETAKNFHMKVDDLLIKHGASVNARDKDGYKALLRAAWGGKYELVELLLQKGADVDLCNNYNITPLIGAAQFGHVKIVELLIKHGASVNARDDDGYTALLRAAWGGKYEVVELLLQKGADVDLCNNYNITPLIGAAQFGYVQIVELLIKLGASVNARDKYGYTALLRAAWGGKYELVELLLQNGADVVLCNNYNITPLIGAAQFGHVQIVELLIKHGASVNARDKYGYTALLRAAWGGKYELVELLLQNGADVDLCNNYNITPLIGAAQFGHVQVVELLIKYGASVNARDKDGYTAVSRASCGGKYELVELLLQKGADVDLCNNYNNTTPLMEAARNCHMKVDELLIKHGASINSASEGENEVVDLLFQKRDDINSSYNISTPLNKSMCCVIL